MVIIIIMVAIIVFCPTYMIAYNKGYWKGRMEELDNVEKSFSRK